MAKTEGTQSIPSELLDAYRATLGEQAPNLVVEKRYPHKVPRMRDGRGNVTAKQRIQRDRFTYVKEKFGTLSAAEKARWYAAMPEWSSLLWYYNYFIMSGLMDVLGANPEGLQVIKSLKHYEFTLPIGNPVNVTVAISDVDPGKAVPFFYGAGVYEMGDGPSAAAAVYPYLVAMYTTHVVVKAPIYNHISAGCGITIIEYI